MIPFHHTPNKDGRAGEIRTHKPPAYQADVPTTNTTALLDDQVGIKPTKLRFAVGYIYHSVTGQLTLSCL